ncbi:MAG: serine/threonine-protein kinase, partial [Planctomycetota bacterium]
MLERDDIDFGPKQRALITAALDQFRGLANTAAVAGQVTPTDSARAAPRATAPEIPGYQLIQEIHRGGQGIVYEAIQRSTERRVAIKVIREGPSAAEHERARFEREVQILTRLKHPHIVTVFDSGVAGEWAYFVMDFIPGESLNVYARRHQLSMVDRVRLFQQVCDAVNAAHLRGIIHRDLKPNNTRVGPEGDAHVL